MSDKPVIKAEKVLAELNRLRADLSKDPTDIEWFTRLRAALSPTHDLTAAGGVTTLDDVRALRSINIHTALGMAIYTGRLDLAELRAML